MNNTRKQYRLKEFDYSSAGTYFVTICTKQRHNQFWQKDFLASFMQKGLATELDYCVDSVGATIGRPKGIELSNFGLVVQDCILRVSSKYTAIVVDYFVIMPDHVHLLLRFDSNFNGLPMAAPTLSQVVSQFKASVSKRIKTSVWQKLFFDHIVRNEQDYIEHVKYILENPMRWRNKQNLM